MNNDWQTPDEIFTPLQEEFGFDVDAAASFENYKIFPYFGLGGVCSNALDPKIDWLDYGEVFWMNPPFQEPLQSKFLQRAVDVGRSGGVVVAIIPAAPETKRWVRYVSQATEIRFYSPRVGYVCPSLGESVNNARFGSAVVVFSSKKLFNHPLCRWVEWKGQGNGKENTKQ